VGENRQPANGKGGILLGLNLDFLLRECYRQQNKSPPIPRLKTIALFTVLLGRDLESVQASLKIDDGAVFAKRICKLLCVDFVSTDRDKELWMVIARHELLLQPQSDRKGDKEEKSSGSLCVLSLLSESQGALLIEDLLPLLPDFR
jgi:hypothetical protein